MENNHIDYLETTSTSSPFFLHGPASIGLSGGRTSAYMMYLILEAHNGQLPPYVKVTFENTGDEVEETLKFIRDIERHWGIAVTWLEWCDSFKISNYTNKSGALVERRKPYDVLNPLDCGFAVVTFETASRFGEPFDRMLDYYAEFRRQIKNEDPVLPNVAQRLCTANLKIKVFERYMKSLGYVDFDAVVGIRKDEPKRWAKMMAENQTGRLSYEYNLPLYTAGITKQHVMDFWKTQPFDLEIDANSDEGNCRYCFLKGEHKLVKIARKDIAAAGGSIPPHLQRMVDREQRTGQVFRRNKPSFAQLVQIANSNVEVPKTDEPFIDCICGEGE